MNLVKETERLISMMFFLTVMADGGIVVNRNLGDYSNLRRNRRHSALSGSQICKAFGCVNGECVSQELKNFRIVCSCYTGYEGKLCDRLVCPYSCGEHGTCVKDEEMIFCKCDTGFYGVSCNSTTPLDSQRNMENNHSKNSETKLKVEHNTKLSSIPSVKETPKFVHPIAKSLRNKERKAWLVHKSRPHAKDFHSHAEIDTSISPEICAPGFKCYHGRCDREAMSYGIFRCLCHESYSGLFCEKKCTLNCYNDGYCTVLDDGHQYCVCPFDFTGHYCEKQTTKSYLRQSSTLI